MKTKTKIVLSSVLAIILCASLIAGATFALFTNKSEVNIAVTSGKVEVKAELKDLKIFSAVADETGTLSDENGKMYKQVEQTGSFINGGTAAINAGVLTIDRITPGDKVTFDVEITNSSNVTIKYQTRVQVLSGYNLFKGLDVTINDVEYNGSTQMSNWAVLNPNSAKETKHVVVELPITEGNVYQNLSTSMQFTVEAVQGNAVTADPESAEKTIFVYSASDLFLAAESINSGSANGYTIKLMNDIDLNNIEWTQINGAGKGITFDGNSKTIKNLKVSEGHNAGLFATGSGCTIKNLTVDGASVTGVGRIAVICGHGMCVKVENCTVKNATITAEVTNNDDGDKAGAIVGYLSGEPNASVTGCTAENVTVKGYRDIGGLVGNAGGTYTVTGNTIKNSTIINDQTNNYKNYTGEAFDIHEMIGEQGAAGTVSGNTATNVTINKIAPIVVEEGKTAQQAVQSAIASAQAGDTLVLPASETPIVISSISQPITIVGDGATKVDASTAGTSVSVAPGVTFENVNFYAGNATYNTIRGIVTYINCSFDGLVNSYDNSTYIGCTFTNSTSGKYLAHVYAGTAKFTGCTFNGSNRCVYVYTEGGNADVTFEDCTFNMTDNSGKAAIMANANNNGGFSEIKIINCHAYGGNAIGPYSEGDPITEEGQYNGLWGVKSWSSVEGYLYAKITVDGTVVFNNQKPAAN